MPHKAQMMLKLAQVAQAAARDGRQQVPFLPQVATNVWDTLQGSGPAPQSRPGASQSSREALHQSFGRLHLGPGQDDLAYTQALLLQGLHGPHLQDGMTATNRWAPGGEPLHNPAYSSGLVHPPWELPADTAASYDTASRQLPVATMLLPHISGAAAVDALHQSVFGMLPSNNLTAVQAASARRQQEAQQQQQRHLSAVPQQDVPKGQAGARKARYNSSVTLNKQIMSAYTVSELLELVYEKRSQFDFFNISSAIARVPKLVCANGVNGVQLDNTAKLLVDELSELMCKLMDTFDARGLANATWAFGKLKYVPNQKLPAQIAAASVGKIRQFSAQNLSNMLWSFVYLHYRNEELLQVAAEQVRQKVTLFKPQELANVVWAFASQDFYHKELMTAVAARALTMVDQFKEQELSNVLWAFGKLKHYDKVLFLRMLGAVAVKLPHFLPQGVSNVAWALAAVGHRDPLLFDQLVGHCMADIGSYDVQGLSNLLWACATMGHKDLAFLDAVLQECTRRLDRLSTQNLSNILWSCATLGYVDPHMLSSWAQATLNKLESFEPQGLSNTAWAFAKLGYPQPQLFEEIAASALGKLDVFTAQGLSNTAWAYATAGHYQPLLFQQLSQQVVDKVDGFNMQNCSVTTWAFATLRHYDKQLFSALLERIAAALGFCEPQNIANTLWAFARMGHNLGQHEEALRNSAMALMPRMQQQELCNTVWALGVLELLEPPVWERFCQCLSSVEGITPEGVHQAYHAQLMMHSQLARNIREPQDLPHLPEPLHTQAREMWLASAVDVHVSRLQQDVSSSLSAAGVPHALEWLTDDGMFSIDLAFVVDGRPVALEVDGSHHFTNSVPQQPLSDVLIRRRLLNDRGWTVVNLSYKNWDMMQALDTPESRANAVLQLVAKELGTSQWQHVELPTRSPDAPAATLSASAGLAAMTGLSLPLGPSVGMLGMGQGGSTWLLGGQAASQQQPWSLPLQAARLDAFNNSLYGGLYGTLQLQAWLNAAAMDAGPVKFEQQQQQQMALMMNNSAAAAAPMQQTGDVLYAPVCNKRSIKTGLGAIGSERGSSSRASNAGSQHMGAASPDVHRSAASKVVTEDIFVGDKRISLEGGAGGGAYKEGDAEVDLSAAAAAAAPFGMGELMGGWGAQGLYGRDIWGHQPFALPLSMPMVADQSIAPTDTFFGL